MSSNENHMIGLHNYEEWLLLYLDDELSAAQKAEVDAFLLLHPPLQEELDLLLSTKLPQENMVFAGKAELHSSAMKADAVDESLLLYIDNELPPPDRQLVEEKLRTDKAYQHQYSLLQQTRVDAAEVIPYPHKEELYRRSHRVAPLFPVWMRIAVAVVLVLFAALFFLLNNNGKSVAPDSGYAVKTPPATPSVTQPEKAPLPSNNIRDAIVPQDKALVAKNQRPAALPIKSVEKETVLPQQRLPEQTLPAQATEIASVQKAEPVRIEVAKLTDPTKLALNNTIATLGVTTANLQPYNPTETPEEPIVTDGDDKPKRLPAKGFLRKVSRFIERRTGIGTVNADNELVIGAVALKLN